MCHAVFDTSKLWRWLVRIDEDLAEETREAGCVLCEGPLHSARYRRKPRGVARQRLDETAAMRLSFCCARDGCRRRHTPPSVRHHGFRFLSAWC